MAVFANFRINFVRFCLSLSFYQTNGKKQHFFVLFKFSNMYIYVDNRAEFILFRIIQEK